MTALALLVPLIVLLGIIALVLMVVAYFRGEVEPETLRRRLLPRFYVYAMLFIASLMILVGGGLLLKGGLAFAFGTPFSYRGEPVYEQFKPGEPPVKSGPPKLLEVKYRDEERARDLINGVSFAVFGLAAYIIHAALRRRVESQAEQRQSFLNKGYLVLSGIVFGGVALVLVPTAINDIANRFVINTPPDDISAFYQRPVPGEMLGFALVALGLWLLLLRQLFQLWSVSQSPTVSGQ